MKQAFILKEVNIALLLSTVILVFIVPMLPPSLHNHGFSVMFSVVFLLSAYAVEKNRRYNFAVSSIAIGLDLITSYTQTPTLRAISIAISLLLFMYIVLRFIFQISQSKQVNVKVLSESVSAYLMLAMAFALLMALTMLIKPDSIQFPDSAILANPEVVNISEYLYYSIVTLSTLGYGDVLPTTSFAKSLITFEVIVGQFYMAIIVALLMGKFINQRTAKD